MNDFLNNLSREEYSDFYDLCKKSVGEFIYYKGTNGDEYDLPENQGKPMEGVGLCLDARAAHGLCVIVENQEGKSLCIDPIEIKIIETARRKTDSDRFQDLEDDKFLLLEELKQCIHKIEFLHGCLTDPNGHRYSYPDMTVQYIKKLNEILKNENCIEPFCAHSVTYKYCDGCIARVSRHQRIADIERRRRKHKIDRSFLNKIRYNQVAWISISFNIVVSDANHAKNIVREFGTILRTGVSYGGRFWVECEMTKENLLQMLHKDTNNNCIESIVDYDGCHSEVF